MVAYLIIGFSFVLYISYRFYQHLFPTPNIDPNGKYVLISGCDTGFGNGLAIELDKRGFHVLAGVLNPETVITLRNKLSSKATIFRLDITKQEDIDAAYDLVKEKTNVLHALVNNAGISAVGIIDWISMESFRKLMDVNFFGHVAMTKKFLPLLIAKRDSRVVNICSVAGFLTGPGTAAYSASKYALESFSDCLRREMFPWSLRVSIFEPGVMRTQINEGLNKSYLDYWNAISSSAQERWGEEFIKARYAVSGSKNLFIKYAEDPMKVVRALEHAVMNTEPKIRYRPGWQSSAFFYPLSMLPAWIVDLFFINVGKSKVLPSGVSKQLQR